MQPIDILRKAKLYSKVIESNAEKERNSGLLAVFDKINNNPELKEKYEKKYPDIMRSLKGVKDEKEREDQQMGVSWYPSEYLAGVDIGNGESKGAIVLYKRHFQGIGEVLEVKDFKTQSEYKKEIEKMSRHYGKGKVTVIAENREAFKEWLEARESEQRSRYNFLQRSVESIKQSLRKLWIGITWVQ